MSTAFLSVVIPVYNRPDLIVPCVQSILKSNLEELEIIIVDDASTDHTLEVCRRLTREEPCIRLLPLEQNHGQGFARNAGLEAAKGEYVFFVDSDDEVDPEALRELVHSRDSWDNADLIGFNYITYAPAYCRKYSLYTTQRLIRGEELRWLYPKDTMWAYFYRRDFLLLHHLNPFSLRIFEDRLLSCEAMLAAESIFISPLYVYHYYRRGPGTSLTESAQLSIEEWISFLEWYKERLSPYQKWDAKPASKRAMERLLRINTIVCTGDCDLQGIQSSSKYESALQDLCENGGETAVKHCLSEFWGRMRKQSHDFSLPIYLCPASPGSRRFAPKIIQYGGEIGGFLDSQKTGNMEWSIDGNTYCYPILPLQTAAPTLDRIFLVLGGSIPLEENVIAQLEQNGLRNGEQILSV